MDLENAFNKQARRNIFDALHTYAPCLLRLFRMFYGFESRLYLTSGEHIGTSQTGVRQGDPMAMLYFSVGHHATLVALNEAVLAVKAETQSELPAGVVGYADDTTVYIGETGAYRAAQRMVEIVGATRMNVKVEKSTILVHPGRQDRVRPPEGQGELFKVVDTGVVVLGNPVGTEDYRRAELSKIVGDMSASMPALTRVDPQAAYAMLQLCYNSRPCYLARVAELSLLWGILGLFDAKVSDILAAIIKAPCTQVLVEARSLPYRLGGLGLPRHQGAQSEKGNLASRAQTKAYITRYRPELASGMDRWEPVQVGLGDASLFAAELEDADGTVDTGLAVLPEEVRVIDAAHLRRWTGLYQYFIRQNRLHCAAWLLSGSCSGTGHWLTWRGGSDGRFRFGIGEFIECLRLRLFVDPFPLPGDLQCLVCNGVHLSAAPFHPLDCDNMKVHRRWRHDTIRNSLCVLLKACFPDAVVEGERPIAGQIQEDGRGGNRTKADVFMRCGAATFVFDITVVDPSAPTYLDRHQSHKIPDAAARERERVKRAGFAALRLEEANVRFVPFAVEATGRMGPAALAFYDDHIAVYHRTEGQLFLAKMSATIAKWNARMVLDARADIGRATHNRTPPVNDVVVD